MCSLPSLLSLSLSLTKNFLHLFLYHHCVVCTSPRRNFYCHQHHAHHHTSTQFFFLSRVYMCSIQPPSPPHSLFCLVLSTIPPLTFISSFLSNFSFFFVLLFLQLLFKGPYITYMIT